MKLLKSLALVMLASTAAIFSAADEETLVTSSSHATASHEVVARGEDALDSSAPVHASTVASPQVRDAISALTTLVDSLADETTKAGLRSIIQSLDTGDATTASAVLRRLLGDTTTDGDRTSLSDAAFILECAGIGTATTTTPTADADSNDHEESEDGEAAPTADTAATTAMVASLVLSNDAPPPLATSTSTLQAPVTAHSHDNDTPATTVTSTLQAPVTDHDHSSDTPDTGVVAGAPTSTTAVAPVAEETDEGDDDESEDGDAADAAEHAVASHEHTSLPLTAEKLTSPQSE